MTIERPIIFSGVMVRAILDGRKTQTRRALKPQPTNPGALHPMPAGELGYLYPTDPENNGNLDDSGAQYVRCPFGLPGDHLWVRETWFQEDYPAPGQPLRYRADGPDAHLPWRPSIQMPRWAARILLEIRDIRVEKLQEISTPDALAEGSAPPLVDGEPVSGGIPTRFDRPSAREQFQVLWNRLNAHRGYSWETNPWVWVLDFRRVAK